MAVIIRHGPAGSYKSSYAVWFELLPALREGRVVVTNVEGMKTLDEIERLLGERFPITARLFRISSQTSKGKKLWQHWYNWVPLGAFVLIDEAQDIYTKTQGFVMEKNLYQGVDAFADDLPDEFLGFYKRVLDKFKPTDTYIDDIGERVVDEHGNVVMPADFSESFQRHRKYNWDIVLCTPNIKKISDEMKSVAEMAVAHKSRDGLGFKRRTRLFEHDPRSTTIKPAKEDAVQVKKVPVAVHLLYQSTATGGITKAGVTASIYKNPKLWMAAAALAYGLYSIGSGIYGYNTANNDSLSSGQAPIESHQVNVTHNGNAQANMAENMAVTIPTVTQDNSMGDSNSVIKVSHARFDNGRLDNPQLVWPYAFTHLYVSGVQQFIDGELKDEMILFESIDDSGKSKYIDSKILSQLGYHFVVLDHCGVVVVYGEQSSFVACRPRVDYPQKSPQLIQPNRKEQLQGNELATAFIG
ncbi:hypothetical protein ABT56_20310 [Photobacterium aquae]|uniref:Zona occludens toxin N-terminal domain-containing protein n=1 Tax=Photobacterium aquae TaxID=1195763 RepID=A0A0J1GU62_9GAMM|nr:zonular occludens toxin domain-containing protein [Photobacterium aquae]KLV03270.1 hypothetical protein ABT56_20310 [Photobacterium aquae]